ncbi:UvrD-helicase domain-containing protein [Ligilactobacillus salivarius]|uniref:DNA helicase n=1 Tax=Ligilactobacillus salivarius TaxID=1624 RepID=A0A1D7TQS2_9LACO|nr:UvrD-helicase domain-containing protein [Ligilactobacillus salivarius]AOO73304.1 DNA helicase [Ligilactobacillus salivarius]UDE97127.1 UvrD-helicase domain-containing protein [Ligilactobacillus salivarius]UUV96248.1 UvrD-helicase domain-containing protein [Ligilactobacillus salivarius]
MDTKIEPEVQDAIECIESNKNFIMEGGAGSGKTRSLSEVIGEIGQRYPDRRILCITYTNNAVNEITNRVDIKNIVVSTIHKFLWNLIKQFQGEIKWALNELIKEKLINKNIPENFDARKLEKITYDDYVSWNRGVISHNEVLSIAKKLFDTKPKLSKIVEGIYSYIFIDEYQDTDKNVVEMFLKNLNSKRVVIGFFGDSMQAIYDKGIGDLNDYNLDKIEKKKNWRNPNAVIKVGNKLRIDELQQESGKKDNIEGNALFFYGKSEELLKQHPRYQELKLSDDDFKRLQLTKKSIASAVGFPNLYELYNSDMVIKLIKDIKKQNRDVVENKILMEVVKNYYKKGDSWKFKKKSYKRFENKNFKELMNQKINKDSLLSFDGNLSNSNPNRDEILKYLDRIYEVITLYENGKIGEFLTKSKMKISSISDKNKISESMRKLLDGVNDDNICIGSVVELAKEELEIKTGDNFDKFIEEDGRYLWERIREIPFKEYKKSIEYLEKKTPYATQHSVKGSEYNNVFVMLESKWRDYSFDGMMLEDGKKSSKRALKLFYVCCTRAQKNLVVFYPKSNPNSQILKWIKEKFGEENVINLGAEK